MMRIIFPDFHESCDEQMPDVKLSDGIISKIQKMDNQAKKIYVTLPESQNQTYEKYTSSFFE